jgi:lipopolysaccharide export system permease protein
MTRTHELVVARAAGLSVWQFLAPAMMVVTGISLFMMLVLSPITATMLLRFEQMEAQYFKGKTSLLSVSGSGLWLRQREEEENTPNPRTAETIIHALRVSAQEMKLYDVIIFTLDEEDRFMRRVDAAAASLQDGYWLLEDALVTGPESKPASFPQVTLPTRLTVNQIQESFSPPETLSFWQLPGFIKTMEDSGFSAQRHMLYWYSLLATPFFLCAMVMVGAVFALKHHRMGGTGRLIGAGLAVGFLFYFITDIVNALALSGSLPPMLAAWSITGVTLVIGSMILLHFEDG